MIALLLGERLVFKIVLELLHDLLFIDAALGRIAQYILLPQVIFQLILRNDSILIEVYSVCHLQLRLMYILDAGAVYKLKVSDIQNRACSSRGYGR